MESQQTRKSCFITLQKIEEELEADDIIKSKERAVKKKK
jgi:hypothetical protein